MPQGDNRRLRFLTHDEADLLLESLTKKSAQLYEIALISLHCGLRAGETFALTWGDVDLQRGVMTLRDTKSGRNRTAFMTEAVKEILCEKSRGENDDLVFSGRGGVRITSVSPTFDRVVRDLGFNQGVTDPRQKVVFHTLRHTYASWLVESGVDLYTVKELMGHSTIALTERYSHLGNNTLQNAVKVLEKSMKRGSQGMNRAQVDEGSDA
jgi:integrase